MTLGRQTAVLLGLLLIALIVICAGLFRAIFAPLFRALERNDLSSEGRVISCLFLEQAEGLTGTARDWATWDETWSFMSSRDSSYFSRNIDPGLFRTLDIRSIVLVDTAGRVAAGVENTGEEGALVPLGAAILSLLGDGVSEAAGRGEEEEGFTLLDGVPCVVAVQPILPSIGVGRRMGGLVLVRDLTPIMRMLRNDMPGSSIRLGPSGGSAGVLEPLVVSHGESISVTIALPAIAGHSSVDLAMTRSRAAYAAFARILRDFTVYIAASGLLFSLLTLLLMQKLVVSRLSGLARRILPAAGHMPDGRKLDEVGRLESAIDPLIGRLEQAAADLRASQARTASILAALPDFLVIMDRSGKILSVHPGHGNVEVISPERTEQMSLEEFDLVGTTPSEVRGMIARALGTSEVQRLDFDLRVGDLRRSYEASVVGFGEDQVLVVIRDETQRRRMSEEAARVQKLESLGVLAGGIAHDFNNCLTAIVGNLDMASAAGAGGASVPLERARSACETARLLALRLLTFAAGGEPLRQAVDLAGIVRETVPPMLSGTAVHLELAFARDLPRVDADPEQMAQLFRNLIANSLEAMGVSGIIRISAESVLPQDTGSVGGEAWVVVSVSDTGPGIPPGVVERIFEPYFTTKPDYPGLGLTICHSIVRKHGGSIEAVHRAGGAEFRIRLRAAVARASEEAPAERAPGNGTLAGRRVLVMDDDRLVLETFLEMLHSLGVEASGTVDGTEAVRRFLEARDAGRPWDAVILDLVVPGAMGGLEALARIRKACGTVRAIVSSGYSADAVLSEHGAHGFAGALKKPFTLAELKAALQSALDGPSL